MRFAASLVAAIFMFLVLHVPSAGARGGAERLERAERAVLRAMNAQRRNFGLPPLRASVRLARAADFHTRDMLVRSYFAHTSASGVAFAARIRRFARARAVGETLAMLSSCGAGMPAAVVTMWMNSPPHRAVLLSPSFRRVGIGRRAGRLRGAPACVVTADFGSRR